MKRTLTVILIAAVSLSVLPMAALGQGSNRANEEAHRRAEKFKEKVTKLGPNVSVSVKLFDEKRYTGKVTRIDDTSFDIVDKKGATSTVRFNDVETLEKSGTWDSPVIKGVVIGVTATVVVLTVWLYHSLKCSNGC